jgi:hypothetical protein
VLLLAFPLLTARGIPQHVANNQNLKLAARQKEGGAERGEEGVEELL